MLAIQVMRTAYSFSLTKGMHFGAFTWPILSKGCHNKFKQKFSAVYS